MNADLNPGLERLARALTRLGEALAVPRESTLAQDGTIQRFEFTIELYWKALKRHLEVEGIQSSSPREALQKAFQAGWIEDDAAWLEMLRCRNLTSHTHDEALAADVYDTIARNFPVLEMGVQFLMRKR